MHRWPEDLDFCVQGEETYAPLALELSWLGTSITGPTFAVQVDLGKAHDDHVLSKSELGTPLTIS